MYHTEVNSLRKVTKDSESVPSAKGEIHRRLHKAMLRYHDPKNFAQIREALVKMGREDLIGRGPQHLVPPETADEKRQKAQRGRRGERALTKHTGLPPQFQRKSTNKNGGKSNGKPSASGDHSGKGRNVTDANNTNSTGNGGKNKPNSLKPSNRKQRQHAGPKG